MLAYGTKQQLSHSRYLDAMVVRRGTIAEAFKRGLRKVRNIYV